MVKILSDRGSKWRNATEIVEDRENGRASRKKSKLDVTASILKRRRWIG